MNPKKSDQEVLSVKRIAWIFAIFFSTFIIVDIAYITIAEKTWRGLVTEDGYQKGLQYNQTIEAVKEQKELGWKLQIKYQATDTKKGVLLVELLNKNNQKIVDANLVANIKRPVQIGQDFVVELKFDAETASYNSVVEFPMIGQWDVEIIAKTNDVRKNDIYQDVKRLVIR
jgi:nitrogen fixation protein FixH